MESKVVYQMESAIQRLNKYLRLASYPTLNTFKGVIRDRSDTYACKIENSNLERNEAYSQNTTSLSEGQGNGGGVIYDSGSARYHFLGAVLKRDCLRILMGVIATKARLQNKILWSGQVVAQVLLIYLALPIQCHVVVNIDYFLKK